MTTPYSAPEFKLDAFNCPICGAFAQQTWYTPASSLHVGHVALSAAYKWHFAICSRCSDGSLWREGKLTYPQALIAPAAHEDMPESLKVDFEEARAVFRVSPRSAAALLRLCIQKLCKEAGEGGRDINADIGSLVKKGLSIKVQQALDIVRVIGNEQVHPGTLDVRDDPAIALELFNLVNFIIDDLFSRPKKIEALYSRLPANKLDGIVNRDKDSAG